MTSKGLKVESKLLPSKEVKLIRDEQVYKDADNLLDMASKKCHSYENILDRLIRVIAKGTSPSFKIKLSKMIS